MRALGEFFQELVCFSHDPQGDLRDPEATLTDLQLAAEPSNLGLLRRELPDLLPRLLPGEHPGIAKLAPLGDLGGIDALLPQIRATAVGLNRFIVGGEVVEFLGGRERPTRARASRAGSGFRHGTIVAHGDRRWARHDVGFLVLALRGDRLALSCWPQLTLTRRELLGEEGLLASLG